MATRYILSALLVLTTAALASCENQRSIVRELLDSQYTGFVKLLEQANLLDELDAHAKNHNGLTVLPTTDHFLVNKVSPVLLSWLKRKQNVPTLRRVLLNHFVPGQVHPQSATGQEVTLGGFKLDWRAVHGLHYIGGVPVKKVAALRASDGIAHSLDGLLIPEEVKIDLANFLQVATEDVVTGSVERFALNGAIKMSMESGVPSSESDPSSTDSSTPASSPPSQTSPSPSPNSPAPSPSTTLTELQNILAASGNFSSFLSFISEYGLEDALEQQLLQPTTILVPNNEAFSNVSGSQLSSLTSGGNVDEVLKYHIITSYVNSTDFLEGEGAQTSSGVSKHETTTQVYYYTTLYEGQPLVVYVDHGNVTFGPQNASLATPALCTSESCGELSLYGINGVMIPTNLVVKAPAPSGSGFISVNVFLTALIALLSAFALAS